MAPYLVPPRTLDFAVDILRAARDRSNNTFIQAISLFVRNEPLVVRQVVNSHDLDRLRNDLNERLSRCCELGEECALAADDGELTQDEYDDWYYHADESVSLASDFFGGFAYTLPNCFQRLKNLTIEINRPPDDDEEPDSTYERESSREQEFWTIERIFEDL